VTGEPLAVALPIVLASEGRGYVAASVMPAAGNANIFAEASLFQFLSSEGRTYHGAETFQALQEQQIRSMQLEPSRATGDGGPDEVEQLIQSLRRGGADTTIRRLDEAPQEELSPERPSQPRVGPLQDIQPMRLNELLGNEAIGNKASIRGRVAFTDVQGGAHPVTSVTVLLMDAEPGEDRQIASASTDAEGRFAFDVENTDSDGTGLDVYLVVRAEGDTVRVARFDNNAVHEIASLLTNATTDLPGGAEIELDITASNDIGQPNNVAFEVYEAANRMSRYLGALGEALPRQVTIRYPRTGTDSSDYLNDVIRLAVTDAHDWDNIMHEYGHHLQAMYGMSASPGGPHSIGENLCARAELGKSGGIRLAWGEAWPTFFGTLMQQEGALGALGIPFVADSRYTDTKPSGSALDYDLDQGTTAAGQGGEGDELAIQRALWDAYDPPGDDRLQLPPAQLWRAGRDSQPRHFANFLTALIAEADQPTSAELGAILAGQGIGARLSEPASGATFDGGEGLSFEWLGNLACASSGQERYAIRFFDDATAAVVWETPFGPSASSGPDLAQLRTIFAPANRHLRWTVVSRDLSAPQTGDYVGEYRLLKDAFDPVAMAEPAEPAPEAVTPSPATELRAASARENVNTSDAILSVY
jgi:hypothetical protein